ncbi:hypothetical protein PHMEG_0008591 [Phytophthora megakarya]|uniref:Uncharacterized protein n=1 Tax=Phytophthora megakarya TaxID=4795 RepID=A0A225WKU5_9STRA|nr:hypothetical protein PHMEG_0008591 [Phytophthora megakarya]
MRRCCKTFPEILLVDTTHNINDVRFCFAHKQRENKLLSCPYYGIPLFMYNHENNTPAMKAHHVLTVIASEEYYPDSLHSPKLETFVHVNSICC